VLENYKRIYSEFEEFINSASVKVNGSKIHGLLSYSAEIPKLNLLSFLDSDQFDEEDFFYWNIKDESIEFLALRPLINFHEFGEKRLDKTCVKINAFEDKFYSNWKKNKLDFIPLIVGGIKFAPDQHSELWNNFSDSDWFIPKIILFSNNGSFFLIYNFLMQNDLNNIFTEFKEILSFLNDLHANVVTTTERTRIESNLSLNSYDNWKKIVDEALFNINEGLMTKVVLSREVNYKLVDKFSLGSLLNELSVNYPNCYVFAYKRKKSIYFGASPEKLAKISDNWIEVDALAGSVPRGKTENE